MIKEVSILNIQSSYSIHDQDITASVLNEEPLIMKFDAVLSDEECQWLIEAAEPRLKRSKLANKDVSQLRTSSGMFFEDYEDPPIMK